MIRTVLIVIALVAALALVRHWRAGRVSADTEWIEPAALANRLAEREDLLVVDVRGPEEFHGPLGHVPGARNIPLDEIETRMEEFGASAGRPIVLICQTDRRSATAAQRLRVEGFEEVSVLRGGMVEWNRGGFAAPPQ